MKTLQFAEIYYQPCNALNVYLASVITWC